MKTVARISLVLSLLTPVAYADSIEFPVDSGAINQGDIAPVLKCPAIPEQYSKMITQLNVLKTAIKKDAACEPINSEVASLESLIGKRRDEVQAIIDKSKTQALDETDLAKVKSYVEDVTKKVISTAELFDRNNTCFLADKKALSFGDLASITLDATALAKTIAGPWATPISLGGQALAGIFQGLNTVVKARRGYDFTNIAARQSFVQSLCAYYNYRQDIEYLLYPENRVAQLKGLEGTLSTNLKGVVDNCPECTDLAKKVISNLKGETVTGKIKPADAINADVAKINAIYARPLGTYTVKTLSTLKWITTEVDRIKTESTEDSNIGRDFLSEMKADLDHFMFETSAPAFVSFQANKGLDLYHQFHDYVMGEGEMIQNQAYAVTHKYQNLNALNEGEAIRAITDLADSLKASGQPGLVSRIADYKRKSLELYDRTRIAASVNDTYCGFFQRANVYGSEIQVACEGSYANALRRNLVRLQGNPVMPQPIQGATTKEYVTEWVDSLTKVVNTFNADPNRYKRKNQLGR